MVGVVVSCEDSPENLMAANKPGGGHQAGSTRPAGVELKLGVPVPLHHFVPGGPVDEGLLKGGRKVESPEAKRKERVQKRERSCGGNICHAFPRWPLPSPWPPSVTPTPAHCTPDASGLCPEPPRKGTEPWFPAAPSRTRSLTDGRQRKPASPARKLSLGASGRVGKPPQA